MRPLAIALALASLQAVAQVSGLEATETLLERSSAARQIESSAVPAALERHARAKRALAEAREATNAGEGERALKLEAQARALMIEAVRLAAPGELAAGKAVADYEARMKSAQALLAAHRRVSAEKRVAGAEQTSAAIERLLESAARERAKGDLPGARRDVDQAYLIAKASVASMRGGDTLVRSLDFATKEEEYRYEVDRNDTHQMLIRVLLDGRRDAPGIPEGVERAKALRVRADADAGRGDHAGAVRLLEESTGELVRAIRRAGVFIPG